jgi:hypothetical protein
MPHKSIITKRVSLTEGQWRRVMENMERDDDWDAWDAIVVAPIISETTTTADTWLTDARKEGAE